MHRLLERQLRQHVGSLDDVPEAWRRFIAAVHKAYEQADTDRARIERSLDLVSEELVERNQQLRQQVVNEQARSEMLERQGKTLLDAIQSVALGDLSVEVEIPQGSEVLSGLAAGLDQMIVEMRRLLGEERKRALREQTLRQITEQVHNATDPHTIGRAVAKRLGTALARCVFLQIQVTAAGGGERCYLFDLEEVRLVDRLEFREIASAMSEGKPVTTSAERQVAAVPLLARTGDVLGVLGTYDDSGRPLTQADLDLVSLVAEQVALALESVHLFEQTQAALAEAEATHRRYLRETWDAYLVDRGKELIGYEIDPAGLVPVGTHRTPELAQVLAEGAMVVRQIEGNEREGAQGVSLAVPLKSREGQTIGVIDLYRDELSQPWTLGERQLVQALAEQIAESIISEQLFEQTQLSLAEARRLYEAGRRISAADDIQEVVSVTLDVMSRTVVDQTMVYLFDKLAAGGLPEGQNLAGFWDRVGAEPPSTAAWQQMAMHYARLCATSIQKPVVVTDIYGDERLQGGIREVLVQMEAKTMAILSLLAGNEWLGYVVMISRSPWAFSPDVLRFHQAISNQAAVALRSLRLLHDAETRARRERIIREITAKISDTVELDSILNTTVQELGKALGVSRAFVRLSTQPVDQAPVDAMPPASLKRSDQA